MKWSSIDINDLICTESFIVPGSIDSHLNTPKIASILKSAHVCTY